MSVTPHDVKGIFIALAIVAGYYSTSAIAKGKGLDPVRTGVTYAVVVFSALIGANLYYVVFHNAGAAIVSSFSVWQSGTGSSGAWVGALVGFCAATQIFRVHRWKFADSITVAAALAIFLGRIGCFIKGCCFGTPTNLPWAVTYSRTSFAFEAQLGHDLLGAAATQSLPIHPVQLYEAFFAFLLIGFELFLIKRTRFDGQAFLLFAMLYPFGRFFLELLRGDSRAEAFGIPAPQVIYATVFFLALLVYGVMHFRRKRLEVQQTRQSAAGECLK